MDFGSRLEEPTAQSIILDIESISSDRILVMRQLPSLPFLELSKIEVHEAFEFLLLKILLDLFVLISSAASSLQWYSYRYLFKTVTYIYKINGTEEK